MSQTVMTQTGLFDFFRQIFSGSSRKTAETAVATDEVFVEKPVVKLDPATGLMVERYYLNGRVHRDNDKPAVIEYDPTSKQVVREQYFQNGKLHRNTGKPAFIEYSASTGKTILEVFFEDGKLHSGDNSPPAIDYDRVTGDPIRYDASRPGSPPLKRT
jgi:hypothetical protein